MSLAESQAQFDQPHRHLYFNSAGATLMPLSVREEIGVFFDDLRTDNVSAYAKYLPKISQLRELLAEMMGATAEEVAITHHTAEATSIIANGLDWKPGDTIMTLDNEYPSTIYPWMNLEERLGLELILLEEKDGHVDEEQILEAIHREKPRLFAISAVEWCSGYRFNLQRIGRACREEGTFFFVDTAQALGFSKIDVRSCHISALAGSAWKWLFGPAGQGYLYLRKGQLDKITPLFVGSSSVVNPHDYSQYHFEFQPDMRRFEYSTDNLSALVWWDAGLRFLNKLGLDDLREYVFDLQDYTAKKLQDIGCIIRLQEDLERRSGIMAFAHPDINTKDLRHSLSRENIVALERDGHIRLAFHIYSTREGLDHVVQTVNNSVDG